MRGRTLSFFSFYYSTKAGQGQVKFYFQENFKFPLDGERFLLYYNIIPYVKKEMKK
jgi:hypothetical protein